MIDLLVEAGMGVLVVGLNRQWKQEVTLGRRTNQNVVQIPHSRCLDLLTYKAQRVGIGVMIREERSPSPASFLDGDAIPTSDPARTERPTCSGRRVERGFYRAKDGRRMHADVNGAYTTLRKEFPDACHACSDSQARPGQERGALQVRLAAWSGNVGRISGPSSAPAV